MGKEVKGERREWSIQVLTYLSRVKNWRNQNSSPKLMLPSDCYTYKGNFARFCKGLFLPFFFQPCPFHFIQGLFALSRCQVWLIEANGNFVKDPLLKVCSICPSSLYSFVYIAEVSCKYLWLWRGKYVQTDTSQPVKTATATYGQKKHGLIF